MSSTSFTIDDRDLQFVLFEQLDLVGSLASFATYADFDEDLYRSTLDEASKLAVEVLAPINGPGDRQGCTLDADGNITTPDGFVDAWNNWARQGWIGVSQPAEYGGFGMPGALGIAIGEMTSGANLSLTTYAGLARGVANVLIDVKAGWLSDVCIPKLISCEWGGTMCLTEAGAGSDVGANRTRATPTDEAGVYLLEGEKIFITGGDNDLTSNVIHLVLARTPGSPAGTKGLSIFIVPKFWFGPDGVPAERNGIYVAGIEEKMGMHASATCTLSLGARSPCKGWLLGNELDGIKIMFHMMNEARIGVGMQGLALASAMYNMAVSYTAERVQGSDVTQFKNADAPKLTINQHPDVRRMLMDMRVSVETMRSFVYSLAHRFDRANTTSDEAERDRLMLLVELMTPICKSWCTDLGYQVGVTALQCFGGYGYIGEYPIEQYLRDAKVSSIYEGTNGIQAADLLGRKMRMKGGSVFMTWLEEVNAELSACKATGELDREVAAMEQARDALGAAAMHLGGLGMQGDLKGAMLHATPFLEQFGRVVLGLHALWQARIALGKLEAGDGTDAFYRGKVLNARYYCHNVLPISVALGRAIRNGDQSCLDPALFAGS